jgi:hypothetical protein
MRWRLTRPCQVKTSRGHEEQHDEAKHSVRQSNLASEQLDDDDPDEGDVQ